jgi:hypothetical protein
MSAAVSIRLAVETGMSPRHCSTVLQKLKSARVITCDFRTPDIKNFYGTPRPIKLP